MAGKLFSLFILLTTLAISSATFAIIEEWNTYKKTYGKSYGIFEDPYRKSVYFSNKNQITLHNLRFNRGCETYDLKVNQFSDMTYTEFAKIFQENSIFAEGSPFPPKGACNNIIDGATPWQSSDWRIFGAVTHVKDQGLICNTGWAFAALSSLEGRSFVATMQFPVSLSAQNLIDCIAPATCLSKTPIDAYNYIIREQNVNTELRYPYVGKPGTCRYLSIDIGATCASYGTGTNGNDEIMNLLMSGPIAFEFDPLSFSFMHYKSGVFRTPAPLKPSSGTHFMTIIGHGNDDKGGNYWLVKNSFGTTWGEDGYIRIASNHLNGPIKSSSYPIV